jgi:hypothetical protein
MVIGRMVGAFFLDKPLWRLGQVRYCDSRTCAWLALLFARQQHAHLFAHSTGRAPEAQRVVYFGGSCQHGNGPSGPHAGGLRASIRFSECGPRGVYSAPSIADTTHRWFLFSRALRRSLRKWTTIHTRFQNDIHNKRLPC